MFFKCFAVPDGLGAEPFGGIPPKSARSCGVSFEVNMNVRRKLKSQTFQHMDRCSNSGENSERRARKKIKVRARKGRKGAKTARFQSLRAPEGRKVGSLERRVRSHLAEKEIKNCAAVVRSTL